MASRLDAARTVARRSLPRALRELEEWLRIPSVSGDPAHRVDVDLAADVVARRLRRMSNRVRVVAAPGGPVVITRIRRAGGVGPTPSVVIYGHLDVRPAGPGWSSHPFQPTRDRHRLVARGASDDKGQIMAHLVALEAWQAVGGPPCDVVVIVDGAEEVGSPGLSEVLRAQRRPVLDGPAVAVVVSDTRMVGPGRPSLTVSQRGMLALRVSVDVGGPPVHAGRFGGAVVDPSLVLGDALGAAATKVAGLSLPRRAAAAPTDADVRAAAGGRAIIIDHPAARSTIRGALVVSGLRARGAPGSIPRRAAADLDVRFPPGVTAARVLALVTDAVRAVRPPGVTVNVLRGQSIEGTSLGHAPAILEALDTACLAGFGVRPVRVASGGSIPAVGLLGAQWGVAPVLLGLGPADDRAHGPDEYLDLDDWVRAIDTSTVFLACLAHSSRGNELGNMEVGKGLRPPAGFRRLPCGTQQRRAAGDAYSGASSDKTVAISGGWRW